MEFICSIQYHDPNPNNGDIIYIVLNLWPQLLM